MNRVVDSVYAVNADIMLWHSSAMGMAITMAIIWVRTVV